MFDFVLALKYGARISYRVYIGNEVATMGRIKSMKRRYILKK